MLDILELKAVARKHDKINLDDLNNLVMECKNALNDAYDICARADKNFEKARDNFLKAIKLRDEYKERSEK